MKKLFCPGPVNVSADIAELAMSTNIGHRSSEFEEIFHNVKYATLKMFDATDSSYVCLPITGSATLANEMCVSTILKPGEDNVLLLNNGVFGERLKMLLNIYHIPFTEYVEEFGFHTEHVRELIANGKFTWIIMVHHETSTGILNPIEDVAAIANEFGIHMMVDAVSSASADNISLEKLKLSVIVTTSGKAIGAYPGIGLICIRRDSVKDASDDRNSDYLDLWANIDFSEKYGQTMHTPSTPLFVALDAQMHKVMINSSFNHDRYLKMNSYIRKEMKKLGVRSFLSDDVSRSVTLSSFTLDPQKYDVGQFIANMNDRGYVLYIGKGKLRDKGMFQIANMGDLRMTDCYDLVESIMKELSSGDSEWK